MRPEEVGSSAEVVSVPADVVSTSVDASDKLLDWAMDSLVLPLEQA